MTTTTVRVNLQYELEDYNVFTKKKPVIVDMQGVRWVIIHDWPQSCRLIPQLIIDKVVAKLNLHLSYTNCLGGCLTF